MGKKKKNKKKFRAKQHHAQQPNNPQQTMAAPIVTPTATQPEEVLTPSISLTQDTDVSVPKSPVASEVKKIALLMTILAAVVVVVAILNVQTDWVSRAGQQMMHFLHIYSA